MAKDSNTPAAIAAKTDPEPNPETALKNTPDSAVTSNVVESQTPASVIKRLKAEAPAGSAFPYIESGVHGWRMKDGSFVALGKPKPATA